MTVLNLMTDQQLIDRLFGLMQNEKRARERGDAGSIAQYKAFIENTLNTLADRGYCKLECIESCEVSK